MSEEFEEALESVDDGRRAFLKKMVVGTAFAVPVVSSFSMAGVQAAFAQTPPLSPRPAETPGTTGGTPTTSSTTTTTLQPNTTQPDNSLE